MCNIKPLTEILDDNSPNPLYNKVLTKDQQKEIYESGILRLIIDNHDEYDIDLSTIGNAESPLAELGDWILHIVDKNWCTPDHLMQLAIGYNFHAQLNSFNSYTGKPN